MKNLTIWLILLLVKGSILAQCPTLVWADEFDGTTLDQANWSYQMGDGCSMNLCGWGNNELQWYTQSNTTVEDGILTITARRESRNGSNYTSSRIRTLNKIDIRYGRIEARMKLPIGQGIWPAFWMLPTDEVYGFWPQSGELDIMEYLGHEPNVIHGTLHFGQPWPNNQSTTESFTLAEGDFHNEWHDYALEWESNEIRWYIDGYLYSKKNRSNMNGQRWPFDQDFHFLLNMAVGGNWPGNPDGSTQFPQHFQIDYIRLYDMTGLPFISGPQSVEHMAENTVFRISGAENTDEFEWSLPESATITSGQGERAITVNWTGQGGAVKVTRTDECGSYYYELDVEVEAPIATQAVLENFDQTSLITRTFNSGEFTDDVDNPASNDINTSELCGSYVRDSEEQYDVLVYDIRDVSNGAEFTSGEKLFVMDIYTDAPIGTQILLQLENKNTAQPSNYPTGRHSRYSVSTTTQNEWERLAFRYIDRPDQAMSNGSINQLVLLFAPNTFTGSTYFIDNFEIYGEVSTSTQEIQSTMEIYPNPVSDSIQLNSELGQKIKSLSIIDQNGRIMTQLRDINQRNYELRTSQLDSGIYFIHMQMDNGATIIKSIIKN